MLYPLFPLSLKRSKKPSDSLAHEWSEMTNTALEAWWKSKIKWDMKNILLGYSKWGISSKVSSFVISFVHKLLPYWNLGGLINDPTIILLIINNHMFMDSSSQSLYCIQFSASGQQKQRNCFLNSETLDGLLNSKFLRVQQVMQINMAAHSISCKRSRTSYLEMSALYSLTLEKPWPNG